MASFNKLPSGLWRAQVRRRGQQVSKCFRLKSEAEAWVRAPGDGDHLFRLMTTSH